jgi:hypothetical protein
VEGTCWGKKVLGECLSRKPADIPGNGKFQEDIYGVHQVTEFTLFCLNLFLLCLAVSF